MSDILSQLGELGEWVSDKEWHQHPIAAEAQREISRWRANHKVVVETKRGTDARLQAALAGLQQIYTVCGDNASSGCDHQMALKFVRQVAGGAFEKATKNLPRNVWQSAIVPDAVGIAARPTPHITDVSDPPSS